MSQDPKSPALEAGEEIIDHCPKCKAKFGEPVATNIKHTCPNPQCGCSFTVMVFDQ